MKADPAGKRVRWRVALLFLVLMPTGAVAQAEPRSGPELIVLEHHPFPDSADPFGFPFPADGGRDHYTSRYAHLDEEEDGFDFPHIVVDGLLPVEGIPDNAVPYVSTRDAYDAAFQHRRSVEPPVILEISAQAVGSEILAAAAVVPRATLEGASLHAWAALVEDHVHFDAGRLGNGITDHRFTVRALQDLGPLELASGVPVEISWTFDADLAPQPDQAYVALWVQQGASHGRFDAHEVVQSTIHRVAEGGVTRQETKGVLMEVYSATWCGPCLYGDTAAEELVDRYGVATVEPTTGLRYLRWSTGAAVAVVAAALGGIALAVARLPGSRP